MLIVAGTTVRGQIDAVSDPYPAPTESIDAYTNYAGGESVFDGMVPTNYVGGNEPRNPQMVEAAYQEGAETTDVTDNFLGGGNQRGFTPVSRRSSGPRFLGVRPAGWLFVAAGIGLPAALSNNDDYHYDLPPAS